MGELQVADVRIRVGPSLSTDFESHTTFKPAGRHEAVLHQMLDQLAAWGSALRTVRSTKAAAG
jgi:hypothetical protein